MAGSHGRRDSGSRSLGLGLGARFALATSLALMVVAVVFGSALAGGLQRINEAHVDDVLERSMEATARALESGWRPQSSEVRKVGRVLHQPVVVDGSVPAVKYAIEVPGPGREALLMVPDDLPQVGGQLIGLIAATLLSMVLVAVAVAFYVGRQVTRPLETIIADVRQLSSGSLRWRGRAKGGAEIQLLSRSLERMSEDLTAARDAELELLSRDEELELAEDVREALNPMTTPLAPGVDLAAAQLPGERLSGAFHDFVELPDGRFGVVVGDVSGSGTPAAILGATARAWALASLEDHPDPAQALVHANAKLAARLQRGSYVTLLYALIDAAAGKATVACCGHRLPLLRVSAADGKLRTFQPEGIALGLDAGPVFERTLEIQDLEFSAGDRLLLATAGAAGVAPADAEELGTKGFYRTVLAAARATQGARKLLKGVRSGLEQFMGGEPFPDGISLVTLEREA